MLKRTCAVLGVTAAAVVAAAAPAANAVPDDHYNRLASRSAPASKPTHLLTAHFTSGGTKVDVFYLCTSRRGGTVHVHTRGNRGTQVPARCDGRTHALRGIPVKPNQLWHAWMLQRSRARAAISVWGLSAR
jgi:hypothetical protein